jgi:uncharacterized protein YfaS (alpha-2-macroglobulin family)
MILTKNKMKNMFNQLKKTGLLLLFLFVANQYIMAQTNYETLWKSVTKLENDGKTKDAKSAVEDIIEKARKDKNTSQTVKALLYKYRYNMTLEENSELNIVNDLKAEIAKSSGTDKAVLQSILAELYFQYFNENSWKFSNRTETDEKQSDDFRTWDLKTLFKEINNLYIASLEEKTLLQQTKLDSYTPILNQQKGSQIFRPTLYDLLANRAIEYFNDDKSNIAEPSNAFSIDDKKYFATANEFVNIKLNDADKNSQDYNALKIYQDLIAFKLKTRSSLDELADADLKRLQFVKAHYFNKDDNVSLYFEALQRIKNEYVKCNVGATINYEIANYIIQKTQEKNNTQAGFPSGIKGIKDALTIIDETIKNYPATEGAKNCAALRETIFHKNISITTEETVIPNEAFKIAVNFKNISKLYFRLIPIKYSEKDKIFILKDKETQADIVKRLKAIKPAASWNQTLPTTDDYLDHITEIKGVGVKKGFYAIIASTNADFTIEKGKEAVAVSIFFSSQISYVTKNNNNSENFELYVLDRNNGQALPNAIVKFYRNSYDYKSRKYIRTDLGSATSDANGYVSKKIDKPNNQNYYNENFLFDISYKDDFLPSEQSYYKYYYPRNETPSTQKQIHLFTDRSIYRPGQTIYFKGIITQNNFPLGIEGGDEHKILTNEKATVIFKDVNYQEIKSQDFTSNEFGSFTGTFIAPITGLLGNMTLETNFGAINVQVEEYKRPKFEVTFDAIKKAYNLNDVVTATGKAVSYSGANIDNAEVKYTVRRVAEFPIWCWFGWRRPWFPPSNEKIITFGTAKTDDNGAFKIDFSAVPDLTISKEFKPYFNYEITADVVDINGETHSTTTTVRVGYLAIEANLSIAENIDYTKENKISVFTNNLNGEAEPTEVSIKIYDLVEPLNPKKTRLWTEPDVFTLSKSEHDKTFPYEIYDKEDLISNWQKGALINSYNFNTGKQKEIVLTPNYLRSGAYMIEFSCKDKNGNPIEFKKTFLSSSLNDKTPNPPAFAYFKLDKTTAKPNETVQYQIGSSVQNAYAVVEVAFKGNIIEKKNIQLNNEIKTFSIPIKEAYKGGLEINYVIVNKNRSYAGSQYIAVPYEDKSLKIEWITFRDKLLPNAKEQWKLKISGTNKEKIAAELLATMYDASLDAFLPHSLDFGLSQSYYNGYLGSYGSDGFGIKSSNLYTSKDWNPYKEYASHGYDDLNLFGLSLGGYRRMYYKRNAMMKLEMTSSAKAPEMLADGMAMEETKEAGFVNGQAGAAPIMDKRKENELGKDTAIPVDAPKKPEVTPRTNLNETAFFLPQLQTDVDGNVILNFQMPEALTKWNFLGLAHTKDLHYQYFTKSVVTQKELMVTPNAPRFLREGDKLSLMTKITNLSDKDLSGVAALTIKDAVTGKEINSLFKNSLATKNFSVAKGLNTAVSWEIEVPSGVDAITYEIVAKAGDFSDGEAAALMVLPNRMMVTETMPLWVRGESKKTFTFDKLLNNKSTTLKNYNLTLEMSSQPVWYAVQALPYMMEYPYECAEQLFSRYYANSLASYIANENPKIKTIFDKWKNTDALLSNLEKNQELKAVLLEETPWVRDAQDETEQKKRIALLFDLSKMADEQQKAFDKLLQMQTPNGGFTWFPGMPDNRYITQHIVAGFGHLAKLNVIDIKNKSKINEVLQKAVAYLDDRLTEDLVNIKKYDKDYLKNNHLYYDNIHALYARSFFDYTIENQNEEAHDYFIKQEKDNWLPQSLYSKGMISLTLQRNKEKSTADKIITSLKQNSINSEELGMYWKDNNAGWYWYQAPVETQALLIEAFTEVANDNKSVDEMKVWLLKQKQTTSWKSTKATAEACYALLLQGKDWTKSDKLVEVKMNKQVIDPVKLKATVEPGTGYYKVKWSGDEIKPEMAKIELKKTDKGPAYGAVYWQYFEDLDKITGATTSLQLTKKLFKEENTNEGKKLIAITDKTPLQVGDVVKVRIELRTDRNLEYIHMKDMRAAGFEPINVLSQYKYQDGLGYYESTKDVATHFFMDWMQKGVYVFEYSMRATIAGNFSNGITLIESMYAPEFKSHSKGERVTITKK